MDVRWGRIYHAWSGEGHEPEVGRAQVTAREGDSFLSVSTPLAADNIGSVIPCALD